MGGQHLPAGRIDRLADHPWQLRFLDEGHTLAAITTDGTLQTWEVPTLSPLRTLLRGGARKYALAVSSSSSQLVVGGEGGALLFFNLRRPSVP